MMMLYTVYIPYVIAKTVVLPMEQNEISQFSSEENYGTVLGVRQSFLSLANVIGPLIGGFVFEYNNRFLFYLSGIITFISIIILVVYKIMQKRKYNNLETI